MEEAACFLRKRPEPRGSGLERGPARVGARAGMEAAWRFRAPLAKGMANIKKFCGEGFGEGELFQKFLFEYTVVQ